MTATKVEKTVPKGTRSTLDVLWGAISDTQKFQILIALAISERTMRRWRNNPGKITVDSAVIICDKIKEYTGKTVEPWELNQLQIQEA